MQTGIATNLSLIRQFVAMATKAARTSMTPIQVDVPGSNREDKLKRAKVEVPGSTREEKLKRAKGYPYPRPDTSFVYINGEAFHIPNNKWKGAATLSTLQTTCGMSLVEAAAKKGLDLPKYIADSEREACAWGEDAWTPILAVGSNAAPEQLARKFPVTKFPQGVVVPVIQCTLEDFDVTFTPYLCAYGACPATLEHSPGTKVEVFITYLNKELELHMHSTEGSYNLCRINNVNLQVGARLADEVGSMLFDSVRLYVQSLGSFLLPNQSTPVALSEIKASRRNFPSLSQHEILRVLWGIVDPAGAGVESDQDAAPRCIAEEPDLNDWIIKTIENKKLRIRYQQILAPMNYPFAYKDVDVLVSIADR